jgi:hypothetical protein
MTTLFFKKNIPFNRISLPIQQQICESTSSLMYSIFGDNLIGYQVLQKFYPVQSMHPKFRRFLIGRSYFTILLISRIFYLSWINKFQKIPKSFVSKLMIPIKFLKTLQNVSSLRLPIFGHYKHNIL